MFSKETKYWQQQYEENKIPQEWLDDCCGETLALLEGKTSIFNFSLVMIILGACVSLFGLFFLVTWI